MAMKQRGKVIVGIIAGFAVVLLIIWMSPVGKFILSGGLSTKEQSFDAQQWQALKNEETSKKSARLLMADDLMQNHLKIGMDSTEVKKMLGEPERRYGFAYGLGTLTPGMGLFYLIITFDTNGKIDKMDVEIEEEIKSRNK